VKLVSASLLDGVSDFVASAWVDDVSVGAAGNGDEKAGAEDSVVSGAVLVVDDPDSLADFGDATSVAGVLGAASSEGNGAVEVELDDCEETGNSKLGGVAPDPVDAKASFEPSSDGDNGLGSASPVEAVGICTSGSVEKSSANC
jgi:hypothetical protein